MIDLIIGFIEIGVGVMLIEFNYMFNLGISLLILGGFYIGKRILSRKGKIVMSEEERKELEELKSLLYRDSITQYGKRNLINLYENLIETQNKMIELMAEHIVSSAIVDDTVCAIKCDCETDILEDCTHEKMLKCTKEYFRNKAKESE